METDLVRGHGFASTHLVKRLDNFEYLDRELNCPKIDKVNTIYWLASYGNMYHQTDPKLIAQVNCLDLREFVSRNKDFDLLVYFSSSSVYGNKSKLMNERMKPLGETKYALAKIGAEQYLHSIRKKHNLVSVRPFSITGVGEQSEHLIPTIIRCALTGEVLNLDPDPVHDFIDAEDVISAVLTIRDFHLEWGRGFEIYNIGSGIQYRNDEVVDLVEQLTGQKVQKKIVSKMRSYDTQTLWQSDSSKLRKLGWRPKKTFSQSIQEMIDEFKDAKGDITNYYPSIEGPSTIPPFINSGSSSYNL